MKKIICSVALIAAVCSVLCVSCKKDSDLVTLKCHVENAGVFGKGYIDDNDYPRFFNEGEQVNVNGNSYSIVPATNWAFDIINVPAPEGNQEVTYYAVYPYSITTAVCNSTNVDVNLPFTQTYRLDGSNQIVDLPMGAVASNRNNVQFYNLCSVLELTITNNTGAAFAVSSIEVKLEGAGLAGKGIASLAGGSSKIEIPAVNPTTNVDNTRIVVDLPTPIQVADNSSSAPIKVVLPPFANKQLSIKVRTDNGAKSVVKRNASFTLERNTIYPLNYVIGQLQEKTDNELSGYFSVSPTDKVVFSKGNLQAYRASASASWSWKFADRQYDFYGVTNLMSTYTPSEVKRDLFLFSSDNQYSQFGLNRTIPDDEFGSQFVDWGINHIDGDPAGETPWFTLSASQWAYLIGPQNESPTSECRPNAANLRAKACIQATEHADGQTNYVYGFLLFPDNWTTPYGITIDLSGMNNISLNEWSRLEAAGAMFLPAAGFCDTWYSVTNTYKVGYYWSSTPVGRYTDEAYNLQYNYNPQYTSMSWQVGTANDASFTNGLSVRLVKWAPGSPHTGTK